MPRRNLYRRHWVCVGLVALVSLASSRTSSVDAKELVVATAATGNGARDAFETIQDAITVARPGDVIRIRLGVYEERLRTLRSGEDAAPITIRSDTAARAVVVTALGEVLRVDHPNVVFEGLVFDGHYGPARTVDIGAAAHATVLRDVEIRRSGRDCLRIRETQDVLVVNSSIHHCLNAADGRTDAHGIVVGAAQRLTIQDSQIHTFSGDGIQLDPARAAPGWANLVIERCEIWLEPLRNDENGFPAGTVPGENAVDTKVWPDGPRSTITIRDTTAWGYQNGLITNMAAFNLKEKIDARVDRVTVWDSEIAFRVRGSTRRRPGSAWVEISNAVVYSVNTAVRYENDIEKLAVWNSTFGLDVRQPFWAAQAKRSIPDIRNLLVTGDQLPRQALGRSNLTVSIDVFRDGPSGDYHLLAGTPPIDAGVPLPAVPVDRSGHSRPQGAHYDIGADEYSAQADGP